MTPPEENATQTRKRQSKDATNAAAAQAVEKRRRTASSQNDVAHQQQIANSSGSDTIKTRAGWSEQALEIFFRDFTQEDFDLQLKVAEKVLTDENKALVFCKMPVQLREHWVKRLREVHQRNI